MSVWKIGVLRQVFAFTSLVWIFNFFGFSAHANTCEASHHSDDLLLYESVLGDKSLKPFQREAFAEVYKAIKRKTLFPLYYQVVPAHFKSIHSYEDVMHECLRRFYEKSLPKYDPARAKALTLFYQIVRNHLFDLAKKRVLFTSTDSQRGYEDDRGLLEVEGDYFREMGWAKSAEVAEINELAAIMREAIGSLSEPYRLAVESRYLKGMSFEEIAESLDIKYGTAKSRVHRGKNIVREYIVNQYPELAKN